jgi:hypothetical protein
MENIKIASILSGGSILLSVASILYLMFYGWSYSSFSLETEKIETDVIGEFEPFSVIWLFLSVSGFIGVLKRNREVLWFSAIVMFLITILTLLSVGLLFIPASLALLIAAILSKREILQSS